MQVLGTVDTLLLTEVYAAGEAPVVAADGRALTRAIRVAAKVEPQFVESVGDLPAALIDTLQDGDVLLTMGAGSIGGTAAKLFETVGAVTEQ